MKKASLMLALVLGLLVSGCVGSIGWARKDNQPIDQTQFEKDREECNRGWGICMAADILLTAGIISTIHYLEAKHCMTVKGYEKIKEPAESEVMSHSGPLARHYHRPDCSVGLKAIPPDQRKYSSEKDAKQRGLIPCPICKP